MTTAYEAIKHRARELRKLLWALSATGNRGYDIDREALRKEIAAVDAKLAEMKA